MGCVRARFYFRLNEKESRIKLKESVTDAKREKTRAKKRRLLFHAMYKKVTIGLFLILIGYEENCANFKLIFQSTWLILVESS